MKAIVKSLILAPVVLLSLTACGKLSDEKAQERINGYSLSDVSAKYASVDIKSDLKINKRTGIFSEDGAMSFIVDMITEALNENQEAAPVSEGFFTLDALDIANTTEGADLELEYYSYKSNGLKVVGSSKTESDSQGMKSSGSSKATVYVLDDGRMEKGEGSMKMSMSGKSSGLTLEGSLDLSFKISYKWNAK